MTLNEREEELMRLCNVFFFIEKTTLKASLFF